MVSNRVLYSYDRPVVFEVVSAVAILLLSVSEPQGIW